MATSKLGLYLVRSQTKPVVTTYLVIAESANAAQSEAFDFSGYVQLGEAGRIGDFDPGMEGHKLVMQLTASIRNEGRASIVMFMEHNDAND